MRLSKQVMQTTLACVLLIATAIGCVPTGLNATHDYVLVHTEGESLVRTADDDPLYPEFEDEVLSDPKARLFMNVFEHTTEAYLATNTHTRFSQTVANRPVVVIDAGQGTVLRRIRVQDGGRLVAIELALGLGDSGEVDMAYTREALPRAVAPLLMELVGMEPPDAASPAAARDALWQGFAAALEAVQITGAEGQATVTACPLGSSLTPAGGTADAERISTFFCRLLATTSANYPQTYLLWFASYDAGETAYGKILLAMRRMPSGRDVSIGAFAATYGETFPAERAAINALAAEVFGAVPAD
ncbi:MAG: hypothetical protein ACYC4R_01125 [Anaerolineae bacterium]